MLPKIKNNNRKIYPKQSYCNGYKFKWLSWYILIISFFLFLFCFYSHYYDYYYYYI